MTTEGIDESLHGLGGIEEIPSKIGVFSRTQQLRFGGTRDSGGYSTGLEGFESQQRVTKSSRIKPSTRAHESTKENRNSIKTRHKMNKNEMNSKPRRAQGGKGLLSRSISVQNPQESILQNLPLVKRREKQRGGEEGAWEEWAVIWLSGCQAQGEKRGVI